MVELVTSRWLGLAPTLLDSRRLSQLASAEPNELGNKRPLNVLVIVVLIDVILVLELILLVSFRS